MNEIKSKIENEFQPIAWENNAVWLVTNEYCELCKFEVCIRIRWGFERESFVFVTLCKAGANIQEFGLVYLILFLGGGQKEQSAAVSGNIDELVALTRKYVATCLWNGSFDFDHFASFADEQVRVSAPATPVIRANSTIRPEWI